MRVCEDEEERDSSGQKDDSSEDDDRDMDNIDHIKLPKETVCPHSPTTRGLPDPVWTHVKRIGKHDLPRHGMDTECTHICTFPISDDEDGSKPFLQYTHETFHRWQEQKGGGKNKKEHHHGNQVFH